MEEDIRNNIEEAENGSENLSPKERRKRRWMITAVIVLLAVVTVSTVIAVMNNYQFRYYSFRSSTDSENNNDVHYDLYRDGYIKYSGNGVEYQEEFGTARWNYAISYVHPIMSKAGDYVVVYDKGKNKALLFDAKGKVREYTLKAPVIYAEVNQIGCMMVLMEGTDSNYAQLYNLEGKMIAEMKASVEQSGYPLAVAISPRGEQVAVSYYSVLGLGKGTTQSFYDLTMNDKSENATLKGTIEVEGNLIPLIKFVNENKVIAVGNHKTMIYDIRNGVNIVAEIPFEERIKSVLFDEKCIYYITENKTLKDAEGKSLGNCGFYAVNYDGFTQKHIALDMEYDDIRIFGKEIVATWGNKVTIINTAGKVIFSQEIVEENLKAVIPAEGFRNYYAVFNDKITKMHLTVFRGKSESQYNSTSEK